MNVVDLGCCDWGESSVQKLIDRFHPETLYGYDPYPEVNDGIQMIRGTRVVIRNRAAWTHDGPLTFEPNASGTHVVGLGTKDAFVADGFDLAEWLLQNFDEQIVLKMDVEGSEHILIPHLVQAGAFERVSLLLVEFHGEYSGPEIPVPWEPWL